MLKRGFSVLALSFAATTASLVCKKEIQKTDALIIIDVQNCFVNGGSLAVSGSDNIIAPINELIQEFENAGAIVAASLDWHPSDHCSFSKSEAPANCNDPAQKSAGCTQQASWCQDERSKSVVAGGQFPFMQWPQHCVGDIATDQRGGPKSAQLDIRLNFRKPVLIFKKGFEKTKDSYSAVGGQWDKDAGAVVEGGRLNMNWDLQPKDIKSVEENGLIQKLQALKVSRVFITGIATDYCVFSTVEDLQTAFQGMNNLFVANGNVGVNVASLVKVRMDAMNSGPKPMVQNVMWNRNAKKFCSLTTADATAVQLAFAQVDPIASKEELPGKKQEKLEAETRFAKLMGEIYPSSQPGHGYNAVASTVAPPTTAPPPAANTKGGGPRFLQLKMQQA